MSNEERAIREREPEIGEAGVLCIRAWRDLSADRSIGMIAGNIWWTSIRDWCRYHYLGRAETGLVLSVLRYLDNRRADAEGSTP